MIRSWLNRLSEPNRLWSGLRFTFSASKQCAMYHMRTFELAQDSKLTALSSTEVEQHTLLPLGLCLFMNKLLAMCNSRASVN